MQGVFDRSTIEQTGINWVGEDGVLVAASSIALAMIFALRPDQRFWHRARL